MEIRNQNSQTMRYLIALLYLISFNCFAHSGGTDSKGGHRNHSTGEYHYHHGMGPHQHTKNGTCIPKRNRTVLVGALVILGGGYLLTRDSR